MTMTSIFNGKKRAKNHLLALQQTRLKAGALLCALFLTACADGSFNPPSKLNGCADTNSCASNPPLEINQDRPATVSIPSDYNTNTQYPLVIVLHGFGASGAIQSIYFGLGARVDTHDYILIAPNGTVDSNGRRFWNATPRCCAGTDPAQQVDDVSYIRSLITEAAATYSIDENSIGLIGHSNGGFMSFTMACEASDLITSVVSLAGSTFADAASCAPMSYPVSVLALHGDEDRTIEYEGVPGPNGIPSAPVTVARSAAQAGCDATPLMPPAINVLDTIDGNETEILEYTGCQQGAEVQLWTLVGAPHIPFGYTQQRLDQLVDWLIEHPRF